MGVAPEFTTHPHMSSGWVPGLPRGEKGVRVQRSMKLREDGTDSGHIAHRGVFQLFPKLH